MATLISNTYHNRISKTHILNLIKIKINIKINSENMSITILFSWNMGRSLVFLSEFCCKFWLSLFVSHELAVRYNYLNMHRKWKIQFRANHSELIKKTLGNKWFLRSLSNLWRVYVYAGDRILFLPFYQINCNTPNSNCPTQDMI